MHEKGVNFTYNTCPNDLFGKQALAHLPFAMAPHGGVHQEKRSLRYRQVLIKGFCAV